MNKSFLNFVGIFKAAMIAAFGLKLEGILKAEKVYWNNGVEARRELCFEKKNLITLTAKQVMLGSIYLIGQTSDPITSLKIGTGGTIDPEGLFPKPVSQTMTDLFTPLLSVATSYTLNNAVPSVTFIADVDQGTANGSLITEAGLFKASNSMFNIKTFPGIPKTSEFSIHFEWTIKLA
ncbi:hypothetical protein D3C87_460100 [compost metagenome]